MKKEFNHTLKERCLWKINIEKHDLAVSEEWKYCKKECDGYEIKCKDYQPPMKDEWRIYNYLLQERPSLVSLQKISKDGILLYYTGRMLYIRICWVIKEGVNKT